MDKALGYEPKEWEFDSLRARVSFRHDETYAQYCERIMRADGELLDFTSWTVTADVDRHGIWRTLPHGIWYAKLPLTWRVIEE